MQGKRSQICCLSIVAHAQRGYQITIDGQTLEVEAEKTYTVQLKSGESVQVSVRPKPVNVYKDEFLSFSYSPEHTPSKTNIHDKLDHVQLVTQLGTYYLIQEHSAYDQLDVSRLLQVVLKKINAKEISRGYSVDQNPFSVTTQDSVVLNGIKADVSSVNDSGFECIVVAYGVGSKGVVVVTRIQSAFKESEQGILDILWETLKINK
ncbi:MAG: hypothetical protein AAFP70_08755 [Calditrichota bacterium]